MNGKYRPEDLYPMLRGENREVVIHPDDRKYGALLVGGQGTGKCIGPEDLVLLNGRLIAAQDAWKRYATGAEFDGEGWWASPAEPLRTCALDRGGRIVNSPVGRLYRQKVRETLRHVRLGDGSQLNITASHRLLTGEGWSTQIAPDSVVAVPRRLDWPGPRAPADALAAATRRALLTDRPLPDRVLGADRDSARVALRTALDTAGVLDGRRRQVSIACACPLLGEQLRLLLRRFAILSSRVAHSGPVTIADAALPRLLHEIGFSGPQPPAWLLAAAATDTEPGESDGASIPTPVAVGAAAPTGARPDNPRPRTAQPAPGSAPIATTDGEQSDACYLPVVDVREVFHDGWVYDLEVPDHHNFVAGGMLAHNTSALLAFYLNDIETSDTAPIVIDPKSELSHICLRATPADCAKPVWFLDLGRPAFGMNPLRLSGDRPLPVEAGAIAANIVAALLDINENQIFMSSRRYLNHAVIGAIALAHQHNRRAKFEDVYKLLLPAEQDYRQAVAAACADQPDLDQTAAFYRYELPDELNRAGSATTQRLDAPRNKVSLLLQVPSLRRFFHHPTDVALREIIEARDVLIVDANMDLLGEDNSKACMVFLLRMLHTQMQRQVHLPETDRPRVPLLVDEAHYVASVENVVDQIATHRRAGLEPAFGLQYFAQLGSGSQHEEKIRKGVLNLLQSRFLFRMGDAQDAEEATRIAMAVYATMIRDDPDSRARLRVTPEQALNFPNHHCLASWIAGGTRIPSFMGQTYPLPDDRDTWAKHHLNAQSSRVAPYPEQLESTLNTHTPAPEPPESNGNEPVPEREYIHVPYEEKDAAKRLGARWDADAHSWYIPARVDPEAFARWRNPNRPDPPAAHSPATASGDDHDPGAAPADQLTRDPHGGRGRKREVHVDYEPPPEPPNLTDSPVRRIVGHRVPGPPPGEHQTPAPDSLRELAFLDRINEIGPADQLDGATNLPRLYQQDYAILALLDRAGLAPVSLIRRAVLPNRAPRTVFDRMTKLYRHGLVAQHPTGLRQHSSSDGRPPSLYSLTRRGLDIAQNREPPAISPKREWRPTEPGRALRLAHDLHALAWAIELHRLVGDVATDHWRTARYATGRYPVPQTGTGRDRHPITPTEIPLPEKQTIIDVQLKTFTEVKPDLSLELRIDTLKLTFDLLVELDLTSRPSYNHDKLLAYDAFLCGWSLAHPRYRTQGTRPALVFVCPDAHAALALAQEADAALTGRIGVMGTAAEHWYYPGRDHTFFAIETDIHHGNPSALALPPRPPGLRERLTGNREPALGRVALLPNPLIKPTQR